MNITFFNIPSNQFYFRSSSRFAQYIWTGMTGNLAGDVLTASTVGNCVTFGFNSASNWGTITLIVSDIEFVDHLKYDNLPHTTVWDAVAEYILRPKND